MWAKSLLRPMKTFSWLLFFRFFIFSFLLYGHVVNTFTPSTFSFSPRRSLVLSSLKERQASTVKFDEAQSTVDADASFEALYFEQTSPSPGAAEDEKFLCDDSVHFWKNFVSEGSQSDLRRAQHIVSSYIQPSAEPDAKKRMAYWSSQLLRTSYFIGNAALGTLGQELNDRTQAPSFGGNALRSGTAFRLLLEVAKVYEQDWKRVQSGMINFPWDAPLTISDGSDRLRVQWDHRQNNPFFALFETGRVVQESISIFKRRGKFGGKPSIDWLEGKGKELSTGLYPEYYLNDFHYQTDGWLSSNSANVYEVSTETLFLGRQDAMQRQTLVPLVRHFGAKEPPRTILEVGCGTGRFATFVRDNFPEADMTLVDLSSFYLDKARENDEYWRKYRGRKSMQEKRRVKRRALGRASSNDSVAPREVKLVQANAESLPFPPNSFDAVTCVYLFHELPATARANAAAEMARVVKPGGVVVLTDSIQLGDRPPLDESLALFGRFNEPHYKNYILSDLTELFEKNGLVCGEKHVASTTKTLSFMKSVRTS